MRQLCIDGGVIPSNTHDDIDIPEYQRGDGIMVMICTHPDEPAELTLKSRTKRSSLTLNNNNLITIS